MFYSFHENMVMKGPNEYVYSLKITFKNLCQIVYMIIISYGCVAQNKNNTMIRFLLALTQTQRLKKEIPTSQSDVTRFSHMAEILV